MEKPALISLATRARLMSLTFLAVAAFAGAQRAHAQDIVIGNSSPLTGVLAASNKEALSGAQAYFDDINKRGGINGRKISLIVIDDKQEVKTSVENTRQLIEEKKALALFMYRTSPVIEAVLPMSEKSRVPFLFPQVGPSFAYSDKLTQSFTLRATYQAEARVAIEQATRLGLTKIAILQADDAFGKDAIKGAEAAMAAAKLQPIAIEKFDNKTADASAATSAFVKLQPQAVLLLVSAKGAASLIKSAKTQGLNAQFIVLSNNSNSSFIEDLGEAGRGVAIMQVMPNPLRGTALAADFMKMVEANSALKPSHATLQGYLSARLLVEALQKAGKNLSREKLVSTLETMKTDYGGFRIEFKPNDRNGSDFIEMSIIGKGGKIML